METKNLRQVNLATISESELLEAARQGRLFIAPAIDYSERKAESTAQILNYVSTINSYASLPYHSTINRLWENILNDAQLQPLFLLNRYTSTRYQPNWYRVTAVVCLLREWGIYRHDVTAIQLHMLLEHSTHRTNRYNGMSRYLLDHKDVVALKRLTATFKQS
jgi:hypothetical protein